MTITAYKRVLIYSSCHHPARVSLHFLLALPFTGHEGKTLPITANLRKSHSLAFSNESESLSLQEAVDSGIFHLPT